MTDDDKTVPIEPAEPVVSVPEAAGPTAQLVAPPPRERAKPGMDKRMVGLGVASGIAVVALILVGLMVFAPASAPLKLGATSAAARATQEDEVEEISTRFATSLYSFNYKTIDADLARIRADSTGNFSKELAQVLGEVDVFKKAIVDARGQSSGEVEGVDVRDIEDGTATVRAFVIQSIKNKKTPTPRQQFSAVELTLVRTSDGWKVDDVQQFQTGDQGAPATDGSGQ